MNDTVIVVTIPGRVNRRYVVNDEDAYLFDGEAVRLIWDEFSCRWLRGFGRVDESNRIFTMKEVTRIQIMDRSKVYGS